MKNEALDSLSEDLQDKVLGYFEDHGIPVARAVRADVVLALLTINDEPSLEAAQQLVGRPITICPSRPIPWPPKPVARSLEPVVRKVVPNPCQPSTDAYKRFKSVRLGLTKEQLMARGVTQRDVTRWTRLGYMELA